MTEKQLPVLEKVKEYLINNLGFDSYSISPRGSRPGIPLGNPRRGYKLKNSSAITINHQKARNNCKASIPEGIPPGIPLGNPRRG